MNGTIIALCNKFPTLDWSEFDAITPSIPQELSTKAAKEIDSAKSGLDYLVEQMESLASHIDGKSKDLDLSSQLIDQLITPVKTLLKEISAADQQAMSQADQKSKLLFLSKLQEIKAQCALRDEEISAQKKLIGESKKEFEKCIADAKKLPSQDCKAHIKEFVEEKRADSVANEETIASYNGKKLSKTLQENLKNSQTAVKVHTLFEEALNRLQTIAQNDQLTDNKAVEEELARIGKRIKTINEAASEHFQMKESIINALGQSKIVADKYKKEWKDGGTAIEEDDASAE
jgi:soluble P-type ATPase